MSPIISTNSSAAPATSPGNIQRRQIDPKTEKSSVRLLPRGARGLHKVRADLCGRCVRGNRRPRHKDDDKRDQQDSRVSRPGLNGGPASAKMKPMAKMIGEIAAGSLTIPLSIFAPADFDYADADGDDGHRD